MPHRESPDLMPSSGWINLADLDRMASAAAERTAALIARDALKPGDVEDLVEEGIKRFMDRVGIDDVPEFRRDLMSLRNARVMRETLIKHGLMVTVGLLAAGLCTAIWLAIKGVK